LSADCQRTESSNDRRAGRAVDLEHVRVDRLAQDVVIDLRATGLARVTVEEVDNSERWRRAARRAARTLGWHKRDISGPARPTTRGRHTTSEATTGPRVVLGGPGGFLAGTGWLGGGLYLLVERVDSSASSGTTLSSFGAKHAGKDGAPRALLPNDEQVLRLAADRSAGVGLLTPAGRSPGAPRPATQARHLSPGRHHRPRVPGASWTARCHRIAELDVAGRWRVRSTAAPLVITDRAAPLLHQCCASSVRPVLRSFTV
jgi:hypothetical protein